MDLVDDNNSEEKKVNIKYDLDFDILHYMFGPIYNIYGNNLTDNIVEFRDIDTDEIVGYSILNFERICIRMDNEYRTMISLIDIDKVKEQGFYSLNI